MQHVADLMTKHPVSVDVRMTVSAARHVAASHSVDHLLVTDGATLAGVICICDLADADGLDHVAAHMARMPVSIGAEAPIGDAVAAMRERSCLPVRRRGVLVGVLTKTDLERAGLLPADSPACVACGSVRHLRPHPATGSSMCVDCLAQSHPAEPQDDLGVAD